MADEKNTSQYGDLTDEELGREALQANVGEPNESGALMKNAYDWIETVCTALGLMMIIFMFLFRYVEVDGESMLNTLNNGDKLLISNVFYAEPVVGDIVVVEVGNDIELKVGKHYEKPLIKRVIATEGQTVDLNPETWEITITDPEKGTYVLDESLYSDTVRHLEGNNMKLGTITLPYTVGEDEVFVMGDNRNNSDDSRYLGALPTENIVGRVIIRVQPFEQFGAVDK